MGYTTIDQFDTQFSTPTEIRMRELEERIYKDPEGWRAIWVEALNDINYRLKNTYKYRGLTQAEASDLAKIVFGRVRRGTYPAWSEDWSKWVVDRVLQQPIKKGRPARMKGEELGESETPPENQGEVKDIVIDGKSSEPVLVEGREGEDIIDAELLADQNEFNEEEIDASNVGSDKESY